MLSVINFYKISLKVKQLQRVQILTKNAVLLTINILFFEIMEKNLVEYNCPSDVFMKVLKGKCKTTLLVLIKKGVNRFGEMKRALPTISERMLAKQLDELEADGILSRTVFAEVPPRVEYALTEYGETLYPIVKEIRKWGRIHQEKTLQNI